MFQYFFIAVFACSGVLAHVERHDQPNATNITRSETEASPSTPNKNYLLTNEYKKLLESMSIMQSPYSYHIESLEMFLGAFKHPDDLNKKIPNILSDDNVQIKNVTRLIKSMTSDNAIEIITEFSNIIKSLKKDVVYKGRDEDFLQDIIEYMGKIKMFFKMIDEDLLKNNSDLQKSDTAYILDYLMYEISTRSDDIIGYSEQLKQFKLLTKIEQSQSYSEILNDRCKLFNKRCYRTLNKNWFETSQKLLNKLFGSTNQKNTIGLKLGNFQMVLERLSSIQNPYIYHLKGLSISNNDDRIYALESLKKDVSYSGDNEAFLKGTLENMNTIIFMVKQIEEDLKLTSSHDPHLELEVIKRLTAQVNYLMGKTKKRSTEIKNYIRDLKITLGYSNGASLTTTGTMLLSILLLASNYLCGNIVS